MLSACFEMFVKKKDELGRTEDAALGCSMALGKTPPLSCCGMRVVVGMGVCCVPLIDIIAYGIIGLSKNKKRLNDIGPKIPLTHMSLHITHGIFAMAMAHVYTHVCVHVCAHVFGLTERCPH